MSRYVTVSAATVQRYRRLQEQNALARARYEQRHPGRSHHNKENEQRTRTNRLLSLPFNMWDGEGPTDAGYALFGSSAGDEICYPYLRTEECLQLILNRASREPAIHFWFGGNYDVSMILRELPHRHLRILQAYTRCVWKGYQLEHIPHKWFKVKYGGTTCKIFDIRSFFGGNFQNALLDFGIGTPEERARIEKGKSDRPNFVWADIEEIKEYWRLELKLGPELMQHMRTLFHEAGYVPRSWHGPGALARMALKKHKVYDAKAVTPPEVQEAAQYAFAGGRFELFQAGHIQGMVYNADIHSAYPYFATFLPNLNRGKWRRTRSYEPNAFAIYHIRYEAKPDNRRPFPLFRRMPNGSVVWPHRVEGWYWEPEASLVADDSDAEFLDGWVFDENNPTDRPFKWMAEYYDLRNEWKEAGNIAEYTLKLIINAVYGQLAQRAGWNREHYTAPKSHQLEWAGYITSSCRAAIYRTATACGDKLISIDTDGIYSASPVPCDNYGGALGQWEASEYTDGLFWQSGIYCLNHGDNHKKTCPADCDGWGKAKSRGIKKGSYTAEDLLTCLRDNVTLNLSRHMFITYGLADIHGWELHNTWIDVPHEYDMGGGKRMHFPHACKTYCNPPAHRLAQWSPTYDLDPTGDCTSHKHKLPWLDGPDDEDTEIMRTLVIFDVDHLDEDDMWAYYQ